jgi:EAL domain-containing protein (putative c-di-GMP-specific phosphodiesterase class I)
MARSLKLTVIAEGVETDAQMSFLKDHGCDQIQGYWFSRPASPEEIASNLTSDICQPLNSYSCGPALRNVFADQGRN